MNAVLFKSNDRCTAFKNKLQEHGIGCTVLDFEGNTWLDFDYGTVEIVIYFPDFLFSSNHPQALTRVHDNLTYLNRTYPHLRMFPDPTMLGYYNDKYRQFLFLQHHHYPIPPTIPLVCKSEVERAVAAFGFPMIVKNRFGAGGDAVVKVETQRELDALFKISTLDLFNVSSLRYAFKILSNRLFYYHLIKARRMNYPFLSVPLLAQKFVRTDRDIRIVVYRGRTIEAHWRKTPNDTQWKVNIDAGGIGEWSHIPEDVIAVAEKLGRDLQAAWLALDILYTVDGEFFITEFSPVWHHYAYKEKPTFVYKDDYNIPVPLQEALDLETLVVKSLIGKL